MIIGVPKEIKKDENRVSLTPAGAPLDAEDIRKLRAYVDHVVKERSRRSKAWGEMLTALKAHKSVS